MLLAASGRCFFSGIRHLETDWRPKRRTLFMLLAAPSRWFFLTALILQEFFIFIFFQILTMSCSQLVIISTVGSFVAAVIMPLIVFCLSLCFKSCCKCQNSSPSKSSTQDVSKSESCVVNFNNYYHSPVHCNIPNSVRADTNSILCWQLIVNVSTLMFYGCI